MISIFTLDKRSKYKKVDLIIELKPHINSVNGIWYDFIQKKLFTLSSDKRFLASDIKSNSNITEISKSNFGYTCLKVDTKYNRFFTANEGGVIDIYGKISVIDFSGLNNNSSYCPEISQFGGKISLRQIIYDENKKELITGDESGKIIAWGLKTGQPIFSFSGAEGNSAITKLLYDKDIRLLIAGCKNNMVKFWKLPDNWVNVEVQKFEDEELKKINNEIARRRIKAQQEIEDGIENDFDSDLSQEDDLNGWNYRKDK